MGEGAEVEDRVDFDEENYMDDDDVDEQGEDDDDVNEQGEDDDDDVDEQGDAGVGEDGENVEEDEYEDSKTMSGEKDQFMEADRDRVASEEAVEDEERPVASVNEEDREKHDQLLALPPHGSEVFVGGLPRGTLEIHLRDICDSIGEIFEVRLMKEKSTGDCKGYAFVAFKTREDAHRAIEELNNKEFKGKTLRCSLSDSKHRLFVGNVPKSWTEDQFRKIIEEAGPGVENIELMKDPQNPSRNRGFAFVLYYNNACADYSRQKMSSTNFKLEGNNPTVSWADPKSSPDHSASAQVKALYVKNIPESATTEHLKELFERHGEVTKVVMPPAKPGNKRDFGFIHYAERSSALKAVKDTEKYKIDDQVLEVVLAKPQTEKRSDGYNSGLYPHVASNTGYGTFSGNPYGSYQQPMIYGRGPMPAGMQMVPMVLPDGRIGYVLQQPGAQMQPQPRRNDGNRGGGGRPGSRGGDGGIHGRRYRPY